jgi:hypothetical protein
MIPASRSPVVIVALVVEVDVKRFQVQVVPGAMFRGERCS